MSSESQRLLQLGFPGQWISIIALPRQTHMGPTYRNFCKNPIIYGWVVFLVQLLQSGDEFPRLILRAEWTDPCQIWGTRSHSSTLTRAFLFQIYRFVSKTDRLNIDQGRKSRPNSVFLTSVQIRGAVDRWRNVAVNFSCEIKDPTTDKRLMGHSSAVWETWV